MVEFQVIKIEQTYEFIRYQRYNLVNLTIPNLELYEVTHESVSNFQMRLFYELHNLFWDPYIRIEKNSSYYTYKIRVYDTYILKNINKLEQLVNHIFNTFPFKRYSTKRKIIDEVKLINKISRLNI
uniref:Uncharacterized protein n=1 Tax=viral metagenome TaxID=1070528 RepID=A0A6C0D4W5_9ZZZZ